MQEKLPIIVEPPRLGANRLGELLCGRESYVHVVLFHSLQASATTTSHLLGLITSYLMLGATLLENQCQTMGLAISGGSVPLSHGLLAWPLPDHVGLFGQTGACLKVRAPKY